MDNEVIDILFLDGFSSASRDGGTKSYMGFLFPIAPMLTKNSFNYKVLNLRTLSNSNLESLVDELKSLQMKTIGISTNAENIQAVYEAVNYIKKMFPSVPIILGGPQATFAYEKILKLCNCDIIIRYEGDYKIIRILDYFIRGIGNLNDIRGIVFHNENNELIVTKDDVLIDLDELPIPDYSILTNLKFWHIPKGCGIEKFNVFLKDIRSANNIYLSSRGCPYRCVFCVEGNINHKHRVRSIENVRKDVKAYLEETKNNVIVFADDTFTSSAERVVSMCEMLTDLRKSYDFIWYAEGRVNVLAKHIELIKIMVDAGMWRLQVGIESGSQKILDAQNKQITKEQIKKVFEEAGKIDNLTIVGNLIIGLPGETKDTILETTNFTKELYLLANFRADITTTFLTPFVGTPININPQKYGLKILDEDFEADMQQFSEIICVPENLTYSELQNSFLLHNFEVTSFLKANIFKLNKKDIDKRVLSDTHFSRKYVLSYSLAWLNTLYSINLLRRYYVLLERDSIIKDLDRISIEHVPIRLWDINYQFESDSYLYKSFTGETITIQGNKKFLWEMANGTYSIMDILTHEFSPFELNEESSKEAMDFYKNLFSSFALVFSEY